MLGEEALLLLSTGTLGVLLALVFVFCGLKLATAMPLRRDDGGGGGFAVFGGDCGGGDGGCGGDGGSS